MIDAGHLMYPGLAMLFSRHCENNPSMNFMDKDSTILDVTLDFERGTIVVIAINAGKSVVVEYADSDFAKPDFDALYKRFADALETTWPAHD